MWMPTPCVDANRSLGDVHCAHAEMVGDVRARFALYHGQMRQVKGRVYVVHPQECDDLKRREIGAWIAVRGRGSGGAAAHGSVGVLEVFCLCKNCGSHVFIASLA